MAVASYDTESMNNKIEILDLNLKKPNDGLFKINEFKHEFPPTKMMWIPDYEGNRKDILATTAEYLRIWEIQPETNIFKEHRISRNVILTFINSFKFYYRLTQNIVLQLQASIGTLINFL